MLRKPRLLTDIKFGQLRIIRKTAPEIYLCRCICGSTIELWKSQLFCMVKRHCGCRNPRKGQRRRTILADHCRSYVKRNGERRNRTTWEYNTWKSVKERCTIPTRPDWYLYGGRGIRCCERWLLPRGEGFRNFLADMGPRPQGMTCDRINPQGHYDPTNCRWATAKEQAYNQRRFIWKDEEPPPVEKVKVMEARVDDWAGDLVDVNFY